MKKINLSVLTLVFTLLLANTTKAQGLIDGFTPKKGNFSVTGSYTYSEFDEFYLGKEKTDVPNSVPAHEEITQNIFSLYAKYGISNRVSVILNVPFVDAEGNGAEDPFTGISSISEVQDISLALKVKALEFGFKGGNLDVITAFTVNVPTGYEANGVLSSGSGAFGVDYTAGLHLKTDVGLFSTLLAGYNLRGQTNNNQGGGKFEVPNAFTASGKLGYAGSFIYAELWAYYLNSDSGVDIAGPNFTGNLPETDVDNTSVGVTLYKNILPQLGVSLGYGKIVDGRNVGAATNYSVGLTYNFNK